ncbi:MAG: heavy metal-binding domain-containing protein [Ruminococcus sp.]|nr:heavy metal-binding domain-containing protein [Ruminococcus sp.]
MLLTTTENIGRDYEVLGMVDGGTVQSVNALKDIGAGLKNLVGGELRKYTEMQESSRAIATERMLQKANALGADAVIAIRYSSSAITQAASEVMAYGTAVKFK